MGRRWRLYRPAEPRRGLVTAALLFLVYLGLLYFGTSWGRDADANAIFWPANGAVVAALLVLPPRLSDLAVHRLPRARTISPVSARSASCSRS